MSENPPPLAPTPQEDAERIRLKRLAKLGGSAAASPVPSATPGASSSVSTPKSATPDPARVAPVPSPAPRKPISVVPSPAPAAVVQSRKPPAPAVPAHFDFGQWQHDTIGHVFNVTLDRDVADRESWSVVWLKSLAEELSTGSEPLPRLDGDLIDQLLIARLELDPNMMSDDPEMLQIVASLPEKQTVFEYLVGCWKRLMAARSQLIKRGYKPEHVAQATPIVDKLRELIISYVGLTLQTPDMFPQPTGRNTGTTELADVVKSISSYSGPLLSSSSNQSLLPPADVEIFIGDLGRRFDGDGLEDIIGPLLEEVVYLNEGLRRPEGLGGTDTWRQVVVALEVLVSSKPVASIIPRLPRWNPTNAKAAQFELLCLFGPLLRQHMMPREWPSITRTYFNGVEKRTRNDVESSQNNLRTTIKALQNSLFQIFNAIVRSSPEARDGVLAFFATALNLNWRRTGSHVDARTVASDGFILNLQAILQRFAEPILDAKYSKLDRIDANYLAHSTRLDMKDQTRLKGSSEEVQTWKESMPVPTAPANFITEVFYLAAAYNHIGLQRVIVGSNELGRKIHDYRREIERAESQPILPQDTAAVQQMKDAVSGGTDALYCMETQILDPEMVFRTLAFQGFVGAWLMRIVDPAGKYPAQQIELPLPKEIPSTFAMLPELFVQDILDFITYLLRRNPDLIHTVSRKESFEFIMTFLTSMWYFNNPYIRSKLVQILFQGTDQYDRGNRGVFSDQMQTNPLALKHLLRTLLEFYIDCEITGTHTQFWDKFDYRSNVSSIMQEIWTNPVYRAKLEEVSRDTPFFTKFINLLMNDTTFMLDESVGKLYEVAEIQKKQANPADWAALPENVRTDLDSQLRQMERYVPYFTRLADSNLALFKKFTVEAKGPFLTGEIVDRLAAMLAYNVEQLAGPRCSELRVKDMDKKWGFRPRDLLRDVMQVFINLGEEPEFIRAVASEGRSYSKETFMRAHRFAVKHSLKSDKELTQFALFVEKAEIMRVTIEEDEDFEDIPDEFLDPLMYSMMKDPVTLPSSHTNIDLATIKAHLLSDASDPFNRVPLKIEEVIPNPELKAKIQEFIAEHRRKKREAKQAAQANEDQAMDTGA
ncbi:ubiquitin elongating factor core-domain-containing protein [Auriculariales sp. MPI-PUGE-AT-0066]|nr:ubiquitin elongating factor core-domain-containing protein [Auriculariales sp. MPI-PUGE-AT-0066]